MTVSRFGMSCERIQSPSRFVEGFREKHPIRERSFRFTSEASALPMVVGRVIDRFVS